MNTTATTHFESAVELLTAVRRQIGEVEGLLMEASIASNAMADDEVFEHTAEAET